MKCLIIFFFLMISLTYYSFSQSEYIRRGRNAIGGSAGISVTNKEIDGTALYAGFSYNGFLDLGLTYWKANNGKIHDDIFIPGITFYPIKQEDARISPTIGISIGYSHYKSKSMSIVDVPVPGMESRKDTLTKDLTVDAVNFGISACRRTEYWKGSFFQPTIGAGISIIGSSLEFVLSGSCAIGTRIKGWPLFILMPGIKYQASATTFSLTFGIVS